MRNLKRVLSLTLASVMLMGMMVMGSSAAAGYDDVAETDNVEAIEVLQAIEVMVGDERGFGPERPVNRAEMAVVMGKLLNLDYNYYTALCPFTDVYDWAQGWVGACYANKIVSGRGDGIYDPGATVTAVEAASMLMRALGYFQYQNDYAAGFELATVTQGKKIGIFDNVGSSASEPMTRNQVAQMVLNALQSDTVEPDGNTINLTTPDGTVLTGKVNYVSVTRDEAFATAIKRTQASSVGSQNDGWIVELGERLYDGDLKLYEYTDDEFMRPSRTWEYDGKEIGTYMKKENIRAEYTKGVSKRDLYDLLGRTILQEYDFAYYVDGVLTDDTSAEILTRKTNNYGETGRGVLTQVFVDVEAETIDITSINTYLAKASRDYSSATESVTLDIYGSTTLTSAAGQPVTFRTDSYSKIVSLVDVPEIEDVKQDQYLLVNVSGKDYASHTRTTLTGYEVAAIADVEILSDSTLTRFSKKSDSDTSSNLNQALFKSVVTNGTEYENSTYAVYSDDVLDLYDNDLLVNKTYNIYLDKYGYAIGIDLFEGETSYVFITGFDPSGSNIAYGNADAAAIFSDGTQAVIKVDTKATNTNIDKVDGAGSYFEQWNNGMKADKFALNRWYTYTVSSDNVYTLHPATRMITTEVTAAETIKTNSVRIDENASQAGDTGTSKATRVGDGKNSTAAFNSGTRVYGNDNSVYIVVDTGDTEIVDNSVAKVITEVSGVYTGVQNVEIDVTAKAAANTKIDGTELYDSIYTVYDKNNYIIASVVIGEAKGGNANYAYILTAATFEELVDGNTVWGFDAIVDGKVAHLTTTSKFASVISKLEPGHVQELRYTGNYVSGIKTPDKTTQYWDYDDAIDSSKRIDKEEIYDVGHKYNANHANDCVADTADKHQASNAAAGTPYIADQPHLTRNQASDLKMIGNTLYFQPENKTVGGVTYAKDTGLAIVAGAPAVVIHRVDGENKKVECSSVTQAIAELGDPDVNTSEKEFEGRIVAVLNDQGAAKWVVFISDTEVNTKGLVPTGREFTIVVEPLLHDSVTGATDHLTKVTQVVTSTQTVMVGNVRGWNVTAPVVAGWKPITGTKFVPYVEGTKTYEISFTYTQATNTGSAITALGTVAATTDAIPAMTSVSGATNTVGGKYYIDVSIVGKRSTFQVGDTINVIAGTVSAGASANPANVDLVWNGSNWSTAEITVTAEDGTSTVYTARVVLDNDNTVSASASDDFTGSETVSVTGTEVKIVVTGTPSNGSKITVTPTATSTSTDVSAANVDLTYDATKGTWSTGTFTVTTQKGETTTYTVKVGESSVAEVDTASATATNDGDSSLSTLTESINSVPEVGIVDVTYAGDADVGDEITVRLTAKAGGKVVPGTVIMTREASGWVSATGIDTVTVTAADGTTTKQYKVQVTDRAASSDSSIGSISVNTDAAPSGVTAATATESGGSITIALTGSPAADGTLVLTITPNEAHASVSGTVTLTYTSATTTWSSSVATVTVTAEDTTTTVYTIVVPS